MGVNIMKEMGVNSISELRNLPAERLMKSSYVNSMMTIDGYAITKSPYQVYLDHENNEEALLNGYNVLEADAFVIPTMLFDLPNKNNIHKKLEEYFDTKLADDILNLYIGASAEARNATLKEWSEGGGRAAIIEGFTNVGNWKQPQFSLLLC